LRLLPERPTAQLKIGAASMHVPSSANTSPATKWGATTRTRIEFSFMLSLCMDRPTLPAPTTCEGMLREELRCDRAQQWKVRNGRNALRVCDLHLAWALRKLGLPASVETG